jgi:hypothetical protein
MLFIGEVEGTIKGEALALIPTLVFVDKVLEVVIGVCDRAYLVDLVDKVAGKKARSVSWSSWVWFLGLTLRHTQAQ